MQDQATYVGSYLGILMLIGVAAVICAAMVTLSWLLGPKKVTPYKQSAYECGVAPLGDAKERFPIKFYLVAIVFILFDIEVVLLWPWMTVFKGANTDFIVVSGISFFVYMATLLIGYLYVIRVGAIDWDETMTGPALLPAPAAKPSITSGEQTAIAAGQGGS